MTILIAFDIYRTENLSVFGRQLVARFLRHKNQDAYELLLSDEITGEVWRCNYSVETAKDLEKQTAEALEHHVYSLLRGDVANGAHYTWLA